MEDYGLTLVTAPEEGPISLAEAKAFLRVETGADNALITDLLGAALEVAEHRARRHLVRQTWLLTLPYFPAWELYFPRSPVSSVTSVVYDDLSGDEVTLDAEDYVLAAGRDPAWIQPTFGFVWPATIYGPNSVRVTYVAGAATPAVAPAAAKQAMLMLTAHWYENRAFLAEDRKIAAIPFGVELLLEKVSNGAY